MVVSNYLRATSRLAESLCARRRRSFSLIIIKGLRQKAERSLDTIRKARKMARNFSSTDSMIPWRRV